MKPEEKQKCPETDNGKHNWEHTTDDEYVCRWCGVYGFATIQILDNAMPEESDRGFFEACVFCQGTGWRPISENEYNAIPEEKHKYMNLDRKKDYGAGGTGGYPSFPEYARATMPEESCPDCKSTGSSIAWRCLMCGCQWQSTKLDQGGE